MAFDSQRGRIVLFGGRAATGPLSGVDLADLWEWDGTTWSQQSASGPAARAHHSMIYDPQRGHMVMTGGAAQFLPWPNAPVMRGDTWIYDGITWTRDTGPQPPARRSSGFAYEPFRGVGVLFGGTDISSRPLGDTWEWNAQWTQVQPTVSPSARAGASISSDPAGGVILHGGSSFRLQHDTWHYDGLTWSNLSPEHLPQGISRCAVYDARRARFVMLNESTNGSPFSHWEWDGHEWREYPQAAGPFRSSTQPSTESRMVWEEWRERLVLYQSDGFTGETWEHDGISWTQLAPTHAPPLRRGFSFAYDSTRRETVLFGGGGTGSTWIWNGSDWRHAASSGPVGRSDAGLADDPSRGVLVLFGGFASTFPFGQALGDTWEWDGFAWRQRISPVSPPPSWPVELVCDRSRRRTVLHLGTSPVETWEWDGAVWTQRLLSGGPDCYPTPTMGYDRSRARTILVGNDRSRSYLMSVWEYGAVDAASSQAYGTGCPGRLGVPLLATEEGHLGWLGDELQLRLSPVPSRSLVHWWIGTSTQSWGAIALPFDLGPIGMPSCFLLTDPALVVADFSTGNIARTGIAVPADPNLVGSRIYAQASVSEPGANSAGHTFSQGLQIQLGVR